MSSNAETLAAWMDIASKDLASAVKLASPPDPQLETAVYHCQQAAEKAAKALFVLNSENPPKQHDIGSLLSKVKQFGIDLSDLETVAEKLTDFATRYRYPTADDDQLTPEVVEKAISDAGLFLSRVKLIIEIHKTDGQNPTGDSDVCEVCAQVPCVCPGEGRSGGTH